MFKPLPRPQHSSDIHKSETFGGMGSPITTLPVVINRNIPINMAMHLVEVAFEKLPIWVQINFNVCSISLHPPPMNNKNMNSVNG